jgi:putative transposase
MGACRISGIGEMAARGEARTPGRVVCGDIQRKADGWYLSLVIECEPHRERGEAEAGLDWGVELWGCKIRYGTASLLGIKRRHSTEYSGRGLGGRG